MPPTTSLPSYNGQLVDGYAPVPGYSNSKPVAPVTPTPTTPTATTPASGPVSPALIVTSSTSKANYNSNINTLNNANNNLQNTNVNDPSIVNYLNTVGQPSDFSSRSKLAATNGISNYTGSADQNTQLLNILRNNATKNGANSNNTGSTNNNNSDGGTGSGSGSGNTNTAPKITVVQTTTNPDGTTTAQNSDGSYTLTDTAGATYNLPAGIDPSIGKQLHDNEVQANQDVANAKSTLDSATALLNSDLTGTNPAAVAAANQIKSDYGVLIQQMQAKNKILLGGYAVSASRSGATQYANDMSSNFMSAEIDAANGRISTLTDKMNAAILKSNMAYESGDVKALSAATTDYNNTKKEAQTALMNLQTTVSNAVKQNAADLKAAQKLANDTIANDIKLSTANATGVARSITAAGYKDVNDPKVQAYLENQATALGITNVATFTNAVTKAINGNASLDLKDANTSSIIKKRNSGGSTTPKTTVKFNSATNTALVGAGLTGGDVKVLQQAIDQYGAEAVLADPKNKLSDGVKTILKNLYGIQ